MKAMKDVRSAHVFDLKLFKEFYLVFGINYKNSFYSGNIIKNKYEQGFAIYGMPFVSKILTICKPLH